MLTLSLNKPHGLFILIIVCIPLVHSCSEDTVTPAPPSGDTTCIIVPTSLDFASVDPGGHVDKSFIVTNNCRDTLTGIISESCDHYSIVTGSGPFFLAPCETLTVTVRFEPTSAGTKKCTVETGNALCVDVSCTGEGASMQIPEHMTQ